MEKFGILSFCIAWGLTEAIDAIYVYLKLKGTQVALKKSDAIRISIWGFCMANVAIVELINYNYVLKDISFLLFGISWLVLLKTKCKFMIFSSKTKYSRGRKIRAVVFIFLAIAQFMTVVLKYL